MKLRGHRAPGSALVAPTGVLAVALLAAISAGCSGEGSGDAGTEAGDGDGDGDATAGDGDGDGDGDATAGNGDGDDADGGGGDGDGDGDGDPVRHADAFGGHCGAEPGQIFPPQAPWNTSVREAPVAPESDAVVDYLEAVVDGAQTFRIDMGDANNHYGFNPLVANTGDPNEAFTPREDYFYRPACDEAHVPVVADGRLEGEASYSCSTDGDCHLTVFDVASCRLFEMWKADEVDNDFAGGCLAVWTADAAPGDDLRGLSCTSADAAGLPIMPLLVTPGEIATGEIRHALRFILPNDAVMRDVYVRPGTHNPLRVSWAGEPASGPAGTRPAPYGVRLRLRADFDTSGLSRGARVMAEALKEYGMFHADGGNVTFIASNDVYADHSWSDPEVDLGPNDLRDAGLRWTDFEVVSDLSDTATMSGTSCTRTPIMEL